MSQSRRDFLKQAGIVSAGLISLPAFSNENAESLLNTTNAPFAIHQGLTLEDLTYLNILRKVNSEVSYEVVDSQNRPQIFFILSENKMKGSEWQLDKIKVSALRLGEIYRFRVVNDKNKVIDERFFRTLDTNKKMPKISVASCMSDFFRSACTKMWEAMQAARPDVIFLIGDTCYADHFSGGEPLGFWERYVDTRNRIGLFRHKTLTPTLASWDDHDFGKNDADGSFSQKKFTLELFSTFWLYPEEKNYNRGLGVYQDITLFGQKFYLLDCRYHRSAHTHFGADQEEKLFADLNVDGTPSWLMNGSQYFGGYLKKDSYEYKQNASFKRFCQKLGQVEAPVCFVSGDIHYSELMAIEPQLMGYKTFEITSSSIHSFTFLQQHNFKKNPRRIKGCATSKHNFKIITIDNTDDKFKFKVSCQGDEKKPYYQKTLEIVR